MFSEMTRLLSREMSPKLDRTGRVRRTPRKLTGELLNVRDWTHYYVWHMLYKTAVLSV